MSPRLRFSIVIPAHNEEHYISRTLEHIASLSYPKDHFETIVVENGSSDLTYEIARKFEGENTRVLRSEKGVSKARNVGIDHLSMKSDWVIFLDADTILKKEFLSQLDMFLRESHHRYTTGTVSVRPISGELKARLWFAFYDFGHRITKTSYSINLVKRSLFPMLRFDETLTMGEDLHMIAQAREHGAFFFMTTGTVLTSTRRFEKVGWWHTLFFWIFVALLPERLQRRFVYKVVR